MRCRELRLQILDAILQHLCFRVGCVRIAAARAAAGARSHEAQMSAGRAAA